MPLPSHRPASSGIILPDFNTMTGTHSYLHNCLEQMITDLAQSVSKPSPNEHGYYYTPPHQSIMEYALIQYLDDHGQKLETRVIVTKQNTFGQPLESRSAPNEKYIFCVRQDWPLIEADLNAYLTSPSRQKVLGPKPLTLMPDFNRMADIFGELHTQLHEMIRNMGQTTHSSKYLESHEYTPQGPLSYMLDIYSKVDSHIKIKNQQAGAPPIPLILTSDSDQLVLTHAYPSAWPQIAAELQKAQPKIQASKALSRHFP